MTGQKGMYVTEKCFEDISKNTTELIDVLNHKMIKIENEIKWIKRIGYYMATMITAIAIKSIFFT